MIWSKYNLLFETAQKDKFLYNSFLNLFWKLDEKVNNELIKLKSNPENFDFNKRLHQELLMNRIFVEEENIDFDNFHLQQLLKRFEKAHLSYTIIPTLDCNFRCTYCFENDVPRLYMSKEIQQKVVNFIKQTTKATKYLSTTWYGGEPLLHMDSIYYITSEIKQLDLIHRASIVTNGYLLEKQIVDELYNLNIKSIQITLDGKEEIHNKKRPHIANNDSFNKIISNLDYLVKKEVEGLIVSIRINTDNTNSDDYFDTFQYLSNKYKNKVVIYPGIIKDWNAKGEVSCGFNRKEEIDFIFKQFNKHGLIPNSFYPNYKTHCVAQRIFDYVIGPEGELYKCWSDVGKKDFVVGSLTNDYVNNGLLTKYLKSIDPFESKECRNCFFFFVCGGGCPNQRLKNKFYGTNFDTCTYFKGNLERFLEVHFHTKDNSMVKALKDMDYE